MKIFSAGVGWKYTLPITLFILFGVTVEAEGESVILENVDCYMVWDPMFEGIRVILDYRGEEFSPEYIQGISGAAFRIAGICPCAPTCSYAMEPTDLVSLLGYEYEYIPLLEESLDLESEVVNVIQKVHEEIRNGRPALVWHAFTYAEWDVVCGFDKEKHIFYGRGSYMGLNGYAEEDETRTIRCVDICPALGVILIGEKTGEFKSLEAELSALREAVRHARNTDRLEEHSSEQWNMLEGLACYDRWAVDLAEGKLEPLGGLGHRYCMGVYSSTHKSAAGFLREIAPGYQDEVQVHFNNAADYFERESEILSECRELLFADYSFPVNVNEENFPEAARLVSEARDNYRLAIEEIEVSLELIDES